jgi:mono/diheme cytochrome c family protein
MARYGWLVGLALMAQAAGAEDLANGARIYGAACASCHYRGGGRVDFGDRSPQMQASPDDLLQVILYGRSPKEGGIGMPAFAPALSDADLAALVAYLRDQVQPGAAWADTLARIPPLRLSGSRDD